MALGQRDGAVGLEARAIMLAQCLACIEHGQVAARLRARGQGGAHGAPQQGGREGCIYSIG